MAELLRNKSIVAGAAVDGNSVGLVIVDDDMAENEEDAHGFLMIANADRFIELAFADYWLIDVTVDPQHPATLIAMGEFGVALEANEDEVGGEDIEPLHGPIRSVRLIGKEVYATGMKHQVVRRRRDATWEQMGPDRDADPGLPGGRIDAVDGFNASEIYAVGNGGVIWWFDGSRWIEVPIQTNLVIHDVHCAEDGTVYACGQGGLILRGRRDQFEMLAPEQPLADLWGVRWFCGELFATSIRALSKLKNDVLVPCTDPMSIAQTFQSLDVADGHLWSFGQKDILFFDGQEWGRLDPPETVWLEE